MSLKNTHVKESLKDTDCYKQIKKDMKRTSTRKTRHINKRRIINEDIA